MKHCIFVCASFIASNSKPSVTPGTYEEILLNVNNTTSFMGAQELKSGCEVSNRKR
jgi:hypothetical protein